MKQKMILVIMRDEGELEKIQKQLEGNDFEIITATDGRTGFELARRTNPDLILASLQLDKLDGIDLCFMIRQNERLAATPYILFVDEFTAEERINSYRSGVDAIILSNISARELYTRIDALIKRYQSLAQQRLQTNQSLIGTLDDFQLIDVIQMLNLNQKTGLLNIHYHHQWGRIVFYNGAITWANLNDTFGEEAIEKMVFWKEGHFIFEKNLVQQDANINKPTMQLILDCCQLLDETKASQNETL